MSIVPSGKRKLMKLQQSYNVTNEDGKATQSEVGNDQSSAAPAFDWSALQQEQQGSKSQSVTGPQYGEQDFQQAAQGGKIDPANAGEQGDAQGGAQSDVMWDMGRKGANIRAFVFQTLEELGAPPRLIMDNPDAFFKGKKDLDTGTLSGSYILPSYTKNRKITQEEAEAVALKIGEQFGLSQSLSPVGRNFKIDFRTKDLTGAQDYGTSLQEVAGKGGGQSSGQHGGGGSGGQSMSRAASQSVRPNMKQARTESMYEKLKELGFGEK